MLCIKRLEIEREKHDLELSEAGDPRQDVLGVGTRLPAVRDWLGARRPLVVALGSPS
jgi:hypothetical protein